MSKLAPIPLGNISLGIELVSNEARAEIRFSIKFSAATIVTICCRFVSNPFCLT